MEEKLIIDKRITAAAMVVVALALVLLVYWHVRNLRSEKWMWEISIREKTENWEAMRKAALAAVALCPWRQEFNAYLGRSLLKGGDSAGAIVAFESLIKSYPYHLNALINLGLAYGNMQNGPAAMAAYERALGIMPDIGKTWSNLAHQLVEAGRLEEAADALEKGLKCDLGDQARAEIVFNLGIVEHKRGRFFEAVTALQKAIRLRPDWERPQKALGLIMLERSKGASRQ